MWAFILRGMDNVRRRLDDLLAPVPADEAMPIDYSQRRWAVTRPAAVGAAALGVVVIAALGVWLFRPGAVTMPEAKEVEQSISESPEQTEPLPGASPDEAGTDPAEVVVSVVGLVHHPGVVVLPPGSRVVDAIAVAGGLLPEANFASINHAAVLSDGEQIVVSDVPMAGGGNVGGTHSGDGGGDPGAGGGLVNLNQADAALLETLPGVGPATAQNIVSHRESSGPFGSVDQLMEVSGIGPAKFAQMKDLVTV